MPPTLEGSKHEALQKKHADLWNELSVMPEEKAEQLLDGFIHHIRLMDARKTSSQDLKQTLRSPWFYVALASGLCLPVLLFVLFIYASLALE